jgi:hypothetical protein
MNQGLPRADIVSAGGTSAGALRVPLTTTIMPWPGTVTVVKVCSLHLLLLHGHQWDWTPVTQVTSMHGWDPCSMRASLGSQSHFTQIMVVTHVTHLHVMVAPTLLQVYVSVKGPAIRPSDILQPVLEMLKALRSDLITLSSDAASGDVPMVGAGTGTPGGSSTQGVSDTGGGGEAVPWWQRDWDPAAAAAILTDHLLRALPEANAMRAAASTGAVSVYSVTLNIAVSR